MNRIAFSFNNTDNGTGNQTLPIPASVGQGAMETIFCSSGIRVVVSDIKLNEPAIVKTENMKPCYGFGFCLSGSIEAQSSCFKKRFVVKGGQSGFFNFPEQDDYKETISVELVRRILIYITPDLLLNLSGRNPGQLPSIMTDPMQAPYRITDTITPPMQAAFNQMFN
jgi:hypothetical protein